MRYPTDLATAYLREYLVALGHPDPEVTRLPDGRCRVRSCGQVWTLAAPRDDAPQLHWAVRQADAIGRPRAAPLRAAA